MDEQIEKFLTDYADKTLSGPGFAIYSPQEKENFKTKLLDYFADLIFDTLVRSLNEDQQKEIQDLPDLTSEQAQEKLALLSASVPGFILILQDRFEKVAAEIGKSGQIPTPPPPTAPEQTS